MVAGTVRAGPIQPSDFFDFEFAKDLWLASPTRSEMEQLYDCPDLDEGVFDTWQDSLYRQKQQALNDLATHRDAEAIKRCHDTRLTYKVWLEAYRSWRSGLTVHGGGGWNSGEPCKGIVEIANIFTGRCDDLPDWRHPDDAAQDEADRAIGNS